MALAGRNRARGEVGGGGEEVRGRRGGIRLGAMRSRCVWSLYAWISRVVSKGRTYGDLYGEEVAEASR